MRKLKIYKVLGQRPERTPDGQELPAGWKVFNAPRPLLGHLTWTGEFKHGIFYAAIDPADDYVADGWERENVRDDGWLLEWVSEDRAAEEMWQYYLADYPRVAERYDPEDPETHGILVREYFRRANKDD